MISSMTGYGRAEKVADGCRVTVEISSLNNRFLEFQFRLPKSLAELEQRIKKLLSSRIHRGKVTFSLAIDNDIPESGRLALNNDIADMYYGILKDLQARFNLVGEIGLAHFVNLPDLITAEVGGADVEKIWALVEPVCLEALENICQMRMAEGKTLYDDFLERLELMSGVVAEVGKRAVDNVEAYRRKFEQRIKELIGDYPVDQQRIAMEIALMADKMDVTEETTRLRSHIQSFSQTLDSGDVVGKRIMFILQEMHREANTIGAKAADYGISSLVIKIKEELEKLREQVQNIE